MTTIKRLWIFWARHALPLLLLIGCARVPSSPAPTPLPTISPETEISVKVALSEVLQTQPSAIEIISAQRQDWADTCLGLGQPTELCTAQAIPGWLLIVEIGGATYKVRANDDASIVRVASELP